MAKRVRNYSEKQIARRNEKARAAYAAKEFKTLLALRKKRAAELRERRRANPDKYRNEQYLRYYGITLEKYNEILRLQGGRCAICRTSNPKDSGNKCEHFHVDHDHNKPKGEIRGLLCFDCNILLGKAKDNVLILRSAIQYLEER